VGLRALFCLAESVSILRLIWHQPFTFRAGIFNSPLRLVPPATPPFLHPGELECSSRARAVTEKVMQSERRTAVAGVSVNRRALSQHLVSAQQKTRSSLLDSPSS
jgi:hypothetical protein